MGVEVLIYGYGLVCLSMLVFNLVYSAYLRSGERRSLRRTGRVAAAVEPALEGGALPAGHLARMEGLLSQVRNLLALEEYLQDMPREQAGEYLRRIAPVFPRLAERYRKREEIQGAYFCHFIAEWGGFLGEERRSLAEKTAQFVRRPSVYSKVNALKALCALGEAEVLLDALTWLAPEGEEHLQIHEKIAVEALLDFHGDARALIALIWRRFERFPVYAQRMLLDYIRFKSGDDRDELLAILLDKGRDKELRLSAIRYFGRYSDERARAALLNFVSESGEPTRWEYAAVAASSLARYPGSDTVDALTAAMCSPNWYVRYNSAASLEQLGFTEEALLASAVSDDRYAREMLTYRLEMRRAEARRGAAEEAAAV